MNWRRSSKDNLCARLDDGTLVTVFEADGQYGWCIANGDGPPEFSDQHWETEEEARDAVITQLEERAWDL